MNDAWGPSSNHPASSCIEFGWIHSTKVTTCIETFKCFQIFFFEGTVKLPCGCHNSVVYIEALWSCSDICTLWFLCASSSSTIVLSRVAVCPIVNIDRCSRWLFILLFNMDTRIVQISSSNLVRSDQAPNLVSSLFCRLTSIKFVGFHLTICKRPLFYDFIGSFWTFLS